MKTKYPVLMFMICLCYLFAGCATDNGKHTVEKDGKDMTILKNEAVPDLKWVFSKLANLYFTMSEVTVSQYEKCVRVGVCESKHYEIKLVNNDCNWGYSDRGNHPMNCVDLHGAYTFCQWVGGRLPLEYEWFAEASNNNSRDYPWGNEIATCNYTVMSEMSYGEGGCGKGSTWPVCGKSPGNSVSGLCDMSGNVGEWTWSQRDHSYVVCGASWDSHMQDSLRASFHFQRLPDVCDFHIGFRCVKSNT